MDRLAQADQIDWSKARIDSGSVPALGGRKYRAVSNGSAQIRLEATNVCDITMLLEMVDAIPALSGPNGTLRNGPKKTSWG